MGVRRAVRISCGVVCSFVFSRKGDGMNSNDQLISAQPAQPAQINRLTTHRLAILGACSGVQLYNAVLDACREYGRFYAETTDYNGNARMCDSHGQPELADLLRLADARECELRAPMYRQITGSAINIRSKADGTIVTVKQYLPWSYVDAKGNLYHKSGWEFVQMKEV